METPREIQQILQAVSCIGDVRPRDQLYFSDLAGINIDMSNVVCIGCELGSITRDPVVESRADRN